MKKPIISLLFIFVLVGFSQAQNTQSKPGNTSPKPCAEQKGDNPPDKKTIRKNRRQGIYSIEKDVFFDFGGGKQVRIPNRIKKGDFYRVKVENINLNNYRVELQVKDTVYYSKALDFPVFGSIDISGLESLMGTFKNLAVSSDRSEAIVEPISNETNNNDSESNNFSEASDENINKVNNFLNAQKDILLKLRNDLNDQANEVENLVYKFKSRKLLAKAEPQQSFDSIDLKSTMSNFENLRSQLKTIESRQNTEKKVYDNYFSNAEVIALLKKIKDEPEGIEIAQEREKIEKAYSELSKIRSKAQTLVSFENEEKSFLSVYQLYSKTTYTSLPIQFTGEEAEVKMSFIPKDSASNLQTYHLSPIKFGRSPWYWAVGPGMYNSKHRNDRVGFETIQVNDSTQNFKLIEENSLAGEIGVSALFHAGRKFEIGYLDFGIHLSVGTGVSLGEEIRARMMYGGGLSFGKKNHLTIDIGRATGYVDRLAKEIIDNGFDKMYLEKPSALVKTLQTDWFVSVGYMFSF